MVGEIHWAVDLENLYIVRVTNCAWNSYWNLLNLKHYKITSMHWPQVKHKEKNKTKQNNASSGLKTLKNKLSQKSTGCENLYHEACKI